MIEANADAAAALDTEQAATFSPPLTSHAVVGYTQYTLQGNLTTGMNLWTVLDEARAILATTNSADPAWSETQSNRVLKSAEIRWLPDPSDPARLGSAVLVVPIIAANQLPLLQPVSGRGRRRTQAGGLRRDDVGALAAERVMVLQLTAVASAIAELARRLNKPGNRAAAHDYISTRFRLDSQKLEAFLRSNKPAFTANVHGTQVHFDKPVLMPPHDEAPAVPVRLQPAPAVAKPLRFRARILHSLSGPKQSRRMRRVTVNSSHTGIRALLAAASEAGVPIDGLVDDGDPNAPPATGRRAVLIEATALTWLIEQLIPVIQSAEHEVASSEPGDGPAQLSLFPGLPTFT